MKIKMGLLSKILLVVGLCLVFAVAIYLSRDITADFDVNDKVNPEPTYNTYVGSKNLHEFSIIDGMLYAKGQDTYKLLGDESTYYKEWTKVSNVDSTNIVHIDFANGTLIYQTADGKVYGMGSAEGVFTSEAYSPTDERSSIRVPQLLMKDCKFASLGTRFVLFLKNDATLWFLGESKNGQSTQIADRIGTPVRMAENVVFIKAFGHTSAWIDADKKLYLCGDNSHGQIGNGEKGSGFPTLHQDIVTEPYIALTNCKSVTAEDYTVTALTGDGRTFVWGKDYTATPVPQ